MSRMKSDSPYYTGQKSDSYYYTGQCLDQADGDTLFPYSEQLMAEWTIRYQHVRDSDDDRNHHLS